MFSIKFKNSVLVKNKIAKHKVIHELRMWLSRSKKIILMQRKFDQSIGACSDS